MRKLKKEVWPFQIIIKTEEFSVDEWCTESFGRRFETWYSYNIEVGKRIFAFKEEECLLLFKLRWNCNV
ncbi:MAG TPA: hypothetical protein VIY47_02550 [Ignavibacteriaceae bacterium]